MDKLLQFFRSIPEYEVLLQSIAISENTAVTGIGLINRSHMICSLASDVKRPITIICQDETVARELNTEMAAFLGRETPILPTRELTLYDSAVVSRGWEQKRLRQLYDLTSGKTPLQIMSWDALCQRTMPPQVLEHAAFCLEIGKTYDIGGVHSI